MNTNLPLISCLCVTENRPEFMPWLLWCYDRQTYPHRELVILDSSPTPFDPGQRPDVRVIAMKPGTTIGRKRNRAMHEARGEIFTWFDDDDWQHPQKCALLADALQSGGAWAGCADSWFVNLSAQSCSRFLNPNRQPIFNSAGFKTASLKNHLFPEKLRKASDTAWLRGLSHDRNACKIVPQVLFFWLCHERNISNPVQRRKYPLALNAIRHAIGPEAWGDTDAQLRNLAEALPGPRSNVISLPPPKPTIDPITMSTPVQSHLPAPPPEVSLMIKATCLDAAYLDVMVRHMIRQTGFTFKERAIIVDHPRRFSGKYSQRAQSTEEDLQRVLDKLGADGIIDQVRYVDYGQSTRRAIFERYFPEAAEKMPTHANTGGPIYPTLFGIESAPTDFVLQMDADVFFYSAGVSWVQESLSLMNSDPSLWLMMTHPGPPAGPPGRSLLGANARARWDAKFQLWRFSSATTRYFLCDRRKLHGRLKPIWSQGGCMPLEQCISGTLRRDGAFRGALGNLKTWHLHAWHHGAPFSACAAEIAAAVEKGVVPAQQKGRYDLRLDLARDRAAWENLLRPRGAQIQQPRIRPIPATPKNIMRPEPLSSSALAVVLPVRNRGGALLRNCLESLRWQSAGLPAEIILVSHGSRPEINDELKATSAHYDVKLMITGAESDPWNKSLALNLGIRASSPSASHILTVDSDMILDPAFFTIVLLELGRAPNSLLLCRSSDLPERCVLPAQADHLKLSLDHFRAKAKLRPRYGTGGIQAAARSFYFRVQGYDEDFTWWGAMDGDMVLRARRAGLQVRWIDDRTFMLHQWHPRKFRGLERETEISAARAAWNRNHQLLRRKANSIVRNSGRWGQLPSLAHHAA